MSNTKLLDLINAGCFLKVSANNIYDFFEQTGKELYTTGYVKDSFLENIIKREEKYPTGLVTEAFGVAMPHVEAEHVNKNAICICVLNPPIVFQRMDAPQEDVHAQLAFMMLIKDPKEHTKAISELVRVFMNNKVLYMIKDANSLEEVATIIDQNI